MYTLTFNKKQMRAEAAHNVDGAFDGIKVKLLEEEQPWLST